MNGAATATSTSPAMPLPPMPSTTTFSTYSRVGQPVEPVRGARPTVATCSGRPAVAPNMSRVSRHPRAAHGDHRSRVCSPADRAADAPPASALAIRRACSALVDRGRLVDQHHRDAVADRVAAVQARVVEHGPRRRSTAAVPCPRGRRAPRAAGGRASWNVLSSRSIVGGPIRPGVDRSVVGRRARPWCGPSRGCARVLRGPLLVVDVARPQPAPGDVCAQLGTRPTARSHGARTRRSPGLDVQTEQRLGVRRTHVVPPVAAVHGQAVECGRPSGAPRRRSPRPAPRRPPAGRPPRC